MAEKRKLETPEQANNRKKNLQKKWQKRENWKLQNKQIIEKKKLQKKRQKRENWKLQNKQIFGKEKKDQIFNLEPEQFSPEVNVKHHHTSTKKQKLCCKMYQIPANSNDATTGHKLQLKRPRDPIFMTTVNEKPNEEKKTKTQPTDEKMLWTYCKWGHYLSK